MGPSSYVQAVGSLRTCCLLRLSAPARGRLATAAASFGAKSALFRNLAPLLRVVGRRHRIIAREVPLGAIFIGRHVMIGCKMPPQHRHFFPVLEADDVIGLYRCADRTIGFLFAHIGRASCRDSVFMYCYVLGDADSSQNKTLQTTS